MHKKRLGLALLCGLGMIGAAQATPLFPNYAAPSYYGNAYVSGSPSLASEAHLGSAAGVRYTDIPLAGSSPTPTTDNVGVINHETQAEALYGAGAGTLHAAASTAVGALGSNLPPFTPIHTANAQAQANYSDYALVQGPAGASGFATLRFSLDLEGSIFTSVQDVYYRRASTDASVAANFGVFGDQAQLNQAGISCLPTCVATIYLDTGDYFGTNQQRNIVQNNADAFCGASTPCSIYTVLAAYGTLFSFGGGLGVSASVSADPLAGATATALYRDTMHTYIDVLTPGVSLLTSSGHDYSSSVSGGSGGTGNGNGNSVPEPASLSLLGIGLAGLGITRRRNQSVNPSDYLVTVS